jgi:DUF4097 and DUF4098 domain-containing protein YvlB
MTLFSSLIRCPYCKGNYKSKKEKGKQKYICSTYDNYGQCKRIAVEEEFLLELLERRYGQLTEDKIENVVDYIEVFDKKVIRKRNELTGKMERENVYVLTIHLKNDQPIVLSENFLQL